MSPRDRLAGPKLWKRPEPSAKGPDRSFGGYYRTADRKLKGKDFRGVPLHTTEDAAVAAVRMGYRVVDAQIERGLDMARRLRGAADRAGVGDTSDVLNQAETLLSRGVLLGLEWLESAANQPGSPLKRLLMAEYRLVSSLLGFTTEDTSAVGTGAREASATHTGPARAESRASPLKPQRNVRIQHGSGSTQRAITIARWELNVPLSPFPTIPDLKFHFVSGSVNKYLKGYLRLDPKGAATLEVVTKDDQPAGRWRAAICTSDGEQVGIVEIDF